MTVGKEQGLDTALNGANLTGIVILLITKV